MKFRSDRYVQIKNKDLIEAKNRVNKKNNKIIIDPNKEIAGKLAELISIKYLKYVLALVRFKKKYSRVTISGMNNIRYKENIPDQDSGKNYRGTDFVLSNKTIQDNSLATSKIKKSTLFNLENKSKGCPLLNVDYFNKFIYDPDMLYPIKESDFSQLIKNPGAFTFIWGIRQEGNKPISAYCYLLSNLEIIRMLRFEYPSEIDKFRAIVKKGEVYDKSPKEFTIYQLNNVWDKNKIKAELKELERQKLDEPVYRLLLELHKTEYASTTKTLITNITYEKKTFDYLGEISIPKLEEEIIINDRKSLTSDTVRVEQYKSYYPKEFIRKHFKFKK